MLPNWGRLRLQPDAPLPVKTLSYAHTWGLGKVPPEPILLQKCAGNAGGVQRRGTCCLRLLSGSLSHKESLPAGCFPSASKMVLPFTCTQGLESLPEESIDPEAWPQGGRGDSLLACWCQDAAAAVAVGPNEAGALAKECLPRQCREKARRKGWGQTDMAPGWRSSQSPILPAYQRRGVRMGMQKGLRGEARGRETRRKRETRWALRNPAIAWPATEGAGARLGEVAPTGEETSSTAGPASWMVGGNPKQSWNAPVLQTQA